MHNIHGTLYNQTPASYVLLAPSHMLDSSEIILVLYPQVLFWGHIAHCAESGIAAAVTQCCRCRCALLNRTELPGCYRAGVSLKQSSRPRPKLLSTTEPSSLSSAVLALACALQAKLSRTALGPPRQDRLDVSQFSQPMQLSHFGQIQQIIFTKVICAKEISTS